MKVTVLDHSGVSIEFSDKILFFDYYKGDISSFSKEKPWYVFVSHGHADHYNREILTWKESAEVYYIFGSDIMTGAKAVRMGIHRMTADTKIELNDMVIETLRSTDQGVAYIVRTNNKVIYHAGDLNWWHWEGEPEKDNKWQEISYKREIEKLNNMHIDFGFVVLDPRQEKDAFRGIEWYIEHTNTGHIIPIHMWGEYDLINELINMEKIKKHKTHICEYNMPGSTVYED